MSGIYDAFVSASKYDSGWVDTFLLPGLEAAGLKVCVPNRDFSIGVPELINREKAIEHSRKILLVLTPSWIESEWSAFEALLSQTDDPIGLRRRTLPLLLEDCSLPPRLRALTSADFRDSGQWQHQLKRVTKSISESEFLGALPDHLEEAIRLYTATNFDRDQYARLDQAGESDDRTTLLRKVFIDLHVKLRSGSQPKYLFPSTGGLPAELFRGQDTGRPVSAMRALLKDERFKVVIVGGPGQGKSTLGQYLAQLHRASLLGRQEDMVWHAPGLTNVRKQEYMPTLPRVTFRIILKYFAQWIADNEGDVTVERYISDQFQIDASRHIRPEELHTILRLRPALLVCDGLDEVIDAGLRARLLSQIHEFIQRADQLGSNLQIIATSRPTGYTDQFSPDNFWHLELQPMSPEKVRDYAIRWVLAKVGFEEERRRILDTLKECQAEEHTRLLLTTPLQVSIVLVIIKDGGRPPAQREALFHDYWSTIFRRERAKGKGVIRSEEAQLFGLHAFLGYLLHRRAVRENVISLLAKDEFESYVIAFLRSNDQRARLSAVKERATDIVREATGRLVLLVEPEPGLFGFELRSIQEFFAAAYLSQSARDTQVRFLRLRAIALSEHWRNVALFFAGRVMRNFSGEAANIIELVCRPIDRDMPDVFLRRGAWLALDLAADGVFSNRDLHYGAIEHALSLLDGSLPRAKYYRLQSTLARLSSEDRREIVRPILLRKIRDCGRPCELLEDLLELLGHIPGTKKALLEGLETLRRGDKANKASAFRIATRFKVDPNWLAQAIKNDWELFLESSAVFWGFDVGLLKHMQEVVGLLQPSDAQAIQLANAIGSAVWRRSRVAEPVSLVRIPNSLEEQIVTFCLCLVFISEAERGGNQDIRLLGLVLRPVVEPVSKNARVYSGMELRGLLQRSDTIPNLRLALWSIFWMFESPKGEAIKEFMDDVERALASGVGRDLFHALRFDLRWPLLGAAVEALLKGDRTQQRRLMKALQEDQAAAIGMSVQEYLVTLARTLEAQEWIEFLIELRSEELRRVDRLEPMASMLGLTPEGLIRMHIRYFSHVNLSEQQALAVIGKIEDRLGNGLGAMPLATLIYVEILGNVKIRRALRSMLLRLCRLEEGAVQDVASVVALLIVLADADPGAVSTGLAKRVCELVGRREEPLRPPARPGSLPFLPVWGAMLGSRNLDVRKGVIKLCAATQRLADEMYPARPSAQVFRWKDLEGCFYISSIPRLSVIRLLKASAVPMDLLQVQDRLLNMMQSAEHNELIAWREFLLSSGISEDLRGAWYQFLERILEERHTYGSAIFSGALERYSSLIGQAATGNVIQERALELSI